MIVSRRDESLVSAFFSLMKVPSSEVSLPLHGCVILNAIERVCIFPFCQEMSVCYGFHYIDCMASEDGFSVLKIFKCH